MQIMENMIMKNETSYLFVEATKKTTISENNFVLDRFTPKMIFKNIA